MFFTVSELLKVIRKLSSILDVSTASSPDLKVTVRNHPDEVS